MLEEIKAKIISQKQYYVCMCACVLPVFGLRTTGRARKANKIYSSPCCLCVCVGDKFLVLQLSIQAQMFLFFCFSYFIYIFMCMLISISIPIFIFVFSCIYLRLHICSHTLYTRICV